MMAATRAQSLFVPAVILALSIAAPSDAQVRASPRGGTTQTIDGTTIALDYSRPLVRGRSDLFGGVVPWGKVWTGANWATTIEVDKPITINGNPLSAGKYSIWLQVQPEEWTAIFDPNPRRFHLSPPGEEEGQLRFPVKPASGPHVEVLTWSFPEVSATGTMLQMAWGTTTVSFDIGVESSRSLVVPAATADQYVGEWRVQPKGMLGTTPFQIDFTFDGEHLAGHWPTAPNPRLIRFWAVPMGAGIFAPAELEDGDVFDIVTDLLFEFDPSTGRATSFQLRGPGDADWGTAERAGQPAQGSQTR
jgi:hypothetical protein